MNRNLRVEVEEVADSELDSLCESARAVSETKIHDKEL